MTAGWCCCPTRTGGAGHGAEITEAVQLLTPLDARPAGAVPPPGAGGRRARDRGHRRTTRTGRGSWRATTSCSAWSTPPSSGSTARSRSARRTARWPGWPRSTGSPPRSCRATGCRPRGPSCWPGPDGPTRRWSAYDAAIERCANEAERAHLEERRADLPPRDDRVQGTMHPCACSPPWCRRRDVLDHVAQLVAGVRVEPEPEPVAAPAHLSHPGRHAASTGKRFGRRRGHDTAPPRRPGRRWTWCRRSGCTCRSSSSATLRSTTPHGSSTPWSSRPRTGSPRGCTCTGGVASEPEGDSSVWVRLAWRPGRAERGRARREPGRAGAPAVRRPAGVPAELQVGTINERTTEAYLEQLLAALDAFESPAWWQTTVSLLIPDRPGPGRGAVPAPPRDLAGARRRRTDASVRAVEASGQPLFRFGRRARRDAGSRGRPRAGPRPASAGAAGSPARTAHPPGRAPRPADPPARCPPRRRRGRAPPPSR